PPTAALPLEVHPERVVLVLVERAVGRSPSTRIGLAQIRGVLSVIRRRVGKPGAPVSGEVERLPPLAFWLELSSLGLAVQSLQTCNGIRSPTLAGVGLFHGSFHPSPPSLSERQSANHLLTSPASHATARAPILKGLGNVPARTCR